MLQRRGDYGSPDDFFFKKWADYKFGFGDPNKVYRLSLTLDSNIECSDSKPYKVEDIFAC